ncbi:hypothetical protein KAT24_02640 [Candidatus Pacearchaeota archaeon]|nr:hypothetical protein [Candidatus Pacearchaeota archaeon]
MGIKEEGGDRVYLKEILLNIFHQKRLLVILFVIVILSTAVLIMYIFLLQEPVCGDGTIYDSCSDRKPYFCEQGILVERASICGCFENLTIDGDSCFSKYQTGIKNIALNYVLRGENGTIEFAVYGGLANYLSKLSRSIHHVDGEIPVKKDFKLKKLDEEEQRYLLLPLVTNIQNLVDNKKDQVRVAISIIQKISFGSSEKIISIGGNKIDYARYPYEVLYDEQGVCGEKSELLAFILREMGYGTAFLYYPFENHETIAVKCPKRHSVGKTGYCFIETTGPSIITDDELEYVGVGKLSSEPELIVISEGKSIGNWWYEFKDASDLIKIRNLMEKNWVSASAYSKFEELSDKYGFEEVYNI